MTPRDGERLGRSGRATPTALPPAAPVPQIHLELALHGLGQTPAFCGQLQRPALRVVVLGELRALVEQD
ncbi:hypothetical protein GF380_03440, partial [Candidatus Uhrbacteria bacterium]|nr:hypothetical protein [Candidatus Uhrbacteria bacterium]